MVFGGTLGYFGDKRVSGVVFMLCFEFVGFGFCLLVWWVMRLRFGFWMPWFWVGLVVDGLVSWGVWYWWVVWFLMFCLCFGFGCELRFAWWVGLFAIDCWLGCGCCSFDLVYASVVTCLWRLLLF